MQSSLLILALLLLPLGAESSSIPGRREKAVAMERLNLRTLSMRPSLAARPSRPAGARRPTRPWVENLPGPIRTPAERLQTSGIRTRPPVNSAVGGAAWQAAFDPSPAPTFGFQGAEDDGVSDRSDAAGSVGPEHVITVLSQSVIVHDRSGQKLAEVSLPEFFATLGPDLFCYDGQCVYDPYTDRWLLTAAADPAGGEAGLVVGVSLTGDALGDWDSIFIPLGDNTGLFADSPKVGHNRHWIALQANLFLKSSGEFAESQVIALDKAILLGEGRGEFSRFRLGADEYGASQVPAITYDGTVDELFLVKNWAGRFEDPDSGIAEGLLRVFVLSGSPGQERLDAGEFISTLQESPGAAFVWGDFHSSLTHPGKQNGTTQRIALGDSRIQSVVYRGSSLWCAQTVLLPAQNPSRTALQWWEVFPDGRLFQRHLIDDPTGAWSYAYPSLAVNNHYDVLVGYSAFSSSVFPSAYYRFYPNEGLLNGPRDEQLMRAGEGTYRASQGAAAAWGDWSTTCVDPWNDGGFWTLQTHSLPPTQLDTGRWGVWWSQVTPTYDLGLTLEASSAPLAVGELHQWTWRLTNAVRSFAYNVVVSQVLPLGIELMTLSADEGVASAVDGVIYWDLQQIGMTSLVCRVTGRVTGETRSIMHTVEASAYGLEEAVQNNRAALSVPLGDKPPLIAPELQISLDGSGAPQLSWLAGYLGYALEGRRSLSEGIWTRLDTAPLVIGSRQQITLPTGGDWRYFRLRRN